MRGGRPYRRAWEATMTTTCRSERRPVVTTVLRHALGRAEEEAVVSGWRWDAKLSHRVDQLLVLIEAVGP